MPAQPHTVACGVIHVVMLLHHLEYPNARRIEQMISREPPTPEVRMRSAKPLTSRALASLTTRSQRLEAAAVARARRCWRPVGVRCSSSDLTWMPPAVQVKCPSGETRSPCQRRLKSDSLEPASWLFPGCFQGVAPDQRLGAIGIEPGRPWRDETHCGVCRDTRRTTSRAAQSGMRGPDAGRGVIDVGQPAGLRR